MLSVDPAALGRLNTKSIQQKMDEKEKLLVSFLFLESYGDCLEVKREYYQNCSVLGCVTQCSQSAAHLCEQFLQVQQIRFITLGPLRHV